MGRVRQWGGLRVRELRGRLLRRLHRQATSAARRRQASPVLSPPAVGRDVPRRGPLRRIVIGSVAALATAFVTPAIIGANAGVETAAADTATALMAEKDEQDGNRKGKDKGDGKGQGKGKGQGQGERKGDGERFEEDEERDRDAALPRRQPFAASPSRMAPFPVVRLRGWLTATGARVTLLSVRAPAGARVQVSCRGKSCPVRVLVRRVRRRFVSFPRLHAPLAAGTVLEIVVSRPGQIGKFTRFRIRRSAAPRRLDQCYMPGATRPSPCR